MGRSDLFVHNVKFYEPDVRAIHCMAIERTLRKLAVSRSDNSVEIWDVQFAPVLLKWIPNNRNSVEGLQWFGSRLFSCGLHGYVDEYDTLREAVKKSTPTTGSSVWCLDIHCHKKLLACGTENGYINVFAITEDSLEHVKLLDKQQGRVMCLVWDKQAEHIITGSPDLVRVWNYSSGHVLYKMMVGRSENNKETIVWCLGVTQDLTVISGDSRGYLTFWNGKTGTQLEAFHSHSADILTLGLTQDEMTVYCAGVDPLVAMYGRVGDKVPGRRQWAKAEQRRVHDHDIRALAVSAEEKLYTGGVDGYLALSSFPPKVLIKYPPLLRGSCAQLVPALRYVLLRHLSHVELWRLGEADTTPTGAAGELALKHRQALLARLQPRQHEVITAAGVSLDGSVLCYSTATELRFYRLCLEEKPHLKKLPKVTDCGPSRDIHFYQKDGRHFCAAVANCNDINVIELLEHGPDVIHTIDAAQDGGLRDTVCYVRASADGALLLAADTAGRVSVWSTSQWRLHCSLPMGQALLTSAAFHPSADSVLLTYANLQVMEYSLSELRFTSFSKSLQKVLPACQWRAVAQDEGTDVAVLAEDASLVIVNKQKLAAHSPSKTKSKQHKAEEQAGHDSQTPLYQRVKKYKHVVTLEWLDEREVVVVSVCPLKLTEKLAPGLAKKRFGC